MLLRAQTGFLLIALMFCAPALAQQNGPSTQPDDGRIQIDVVVTPKSGPPVAGLQQQDFTLLDNKVPRAITSFQALGHSQTPLDVVIVVDAVNASFQTVAFERGEIEKFLRTDGGHLAHPAAIALFTDSGMQIQEGFSTDGNALSAALDQYLVGIRSIRRSAAFYGALERFQLSLDSLRLLVARLAARPERKVVLWISPGWPILSGPDVELDSKQEQEIFRDIVGFSTQLLRARITLYSIDPLGSADFGTRAYYYQEFLKGIREPGQAVLGDLALQVLATQSGGLAFTINNDVAALLQKSLADTDAYYELSFLPPSDAKRNEYHQLEIRVSKPGLTARTRQGYYAQPEFGQVH